MPGARRFGLSLVFDFNNGATAFVRPCVLVVVLTPSVCMGICRDRCAWACACVWMGICFYLCLLFKTDLLSPTRPIRPRKELRIHDVLEPVLELRSCIQWRQSRIHLALTVVKSFLQDLFLLVSVLNWPCNLLIFISPPLHGAVRCVPHCAPAAARCAGRQWCSWCIVEIKNLKQDCLIYRVS